MPLVRIPTESGAILYDPSRIDHPQPADFDARSLAGAGRIERTARGRGRVVFVAARGGAGSWVLRHYRRGGLTGRLITDWYAWCGEDATRPFRELRLLAQLEELGLPSVPPVAARYVRAAFGYRADLLTVAVGDSRTLAELLRAGVPAAVWHRCGATIRLFHDAGVCHADLNAHNILVDSAGAVRLIDFDRGRRRPPGRWREGNLARLRHSLGKLSAAAGGSFAAAEWEALRAAYDAPRSAPPR
jgi:3-deoxy-D-manno-octulosonic acid kinase